MQFKDKSKITFHSPAVLSDTTLPFGVASALSILQKTMDTILQEIDGVICYFDNTLISEKTEEEHLDNLRRVLLKVQEHGIRAKKTKYTFLKTSGHYIRHIIDADGLHATDEIKAPLSSTFSAICSEKRDGRKPVVMLSRLRESSWSHPISSHITI